MGCCQYKPPKPELETDLSVSHLSFRANSVLDNIKRQYKFQDKINEGGYSIVYSATSLNSGETRAIKCIPVSKYPEDQLKHFECEVSILQEVDHPNILKILEVFRDKQYIYIVTEKCNGGELFEHITSQGHFSESKAAEYMLQISSAVNYLHTKKIMHRDLKPENIMIESNDSASQVKLIDFGSSKYFTDCLPLQERLGSAYYVAPEVLTGSYDEKCDIWSLGVILYILLSGHPPFSGANDSEIFQNIQFAQANFSDKSWSKISKDAVSLIQNMLNKDPKLRPAASEVYQSAWLQNHRKNLLPDGFFPVETIQNLTSFSVNSKLLRASLNFIAKHMMSSNEISAIRKAFEKLDKNGDGMLSLEELSEGISAFSGDVFLNIEKIITKIPFSEQGIKYSDFLTAAIDWDKHLSKERLKKTFSEFDKDGNGSISLQELMKTLGGDKDHTHIFLQMIKEADLDGNGEIDLEEFCIFMLQAKSLSLKPNPNPTR